MARFPSPASIISRYHKGLQCLISALGWGFLYGPQAKIAQRGKDWRTAAVLWQKATEGRPDDPKTRSGYIHALIAAGQLAEAEVQSRELVRRWPRNEYGPIALARISEARDERLEAIRHWKGALRIAPAHRQALLGLGRSLLSTGQFEEAQKCARRLSATHPTDMEGPILAAQIEQQRVGFGTAAPVWEAVDQRFGNRVGFLRAYGHALLQAEEYDQCAMVAERLRMLDTGEGLRLQGQLVAKRAPYEDHTQFWKEASAQLPDSADFTRKFLHAALWGRRQAEAEAAFATLLKQDRLRAGDAHYAFGLGLAFLESGDKAAARATVRAFLRATRGSFDYYPSALRLERLILACFPRSPGGSVSVAQNPSRFIRMVRNARLPAAANQSLEQIVHVEARLARSGATCLFDTDIDAHTCGAFVRLIRNHLWNHEPFSLVRLGDGEANALAYPDGLASHFVADTLAREKIWWGRTLADDRRAELAARVSTAISNADALGIPTKARIMRDIRLDSEKPLDATRSGRGMLAILSLLERAADEGSLNEKVLVSAHIHQDILRWDLYGALFCGAKTIAVSCHDTIPDILRSRFHVCDTKHIRIPPGDAMREREQRSLDDNELPPQYLHRVIVELGSNLEGTLVVIGAGYAGKTIVDEARKRGAVALDLGSIFDHWAGFHTRSYQDVA